MVAPFTGPFASTHPFRCATPYKWYQSGRTVMLLSVKESCCHMFNSELRIRVYMFQSYCMYETNHVLQTLIKLKYPSVMASLFLIFYVDEVDVLICCFPCN